MSERAHLAPWLGGGPAATEAENLILEGRLEEAEAALRRDDTPWAHSARAALLFQRGDLKGARAEAKALLAALPQAGAAVLAILAASEGRREEAERLLSGAASGWERGLRGILRSRWGDLEGAKADLEAGERSPWVLLERARVLNRLGLFWVALEVVDEVRALLPGSPEPDMLGAEFHLDQAQYAAAARRLTRALRDRPGDAELLRRRAQVRFVQGRWEESLADLRRMKEPTYELCRALALTGRHAEARREAGALAPDLRRFIDGYVLCREGSFKKSRSAFEASAEPRAPFYALVARTLGELEPEPNAAKRELVMLGLGYRQPWQVTRQACGLVRSMETIYSNLSDSGVVDFVGLFGRPLRAIVFRRADHDAVKCARDVMPGFRDHKRVGVVTRGHPLYYGRLAWRLVTGCRKRGYGVRIPGSVSVADTILSFGRPASGVRVLDCQALACASPRLPLVLYNFGARGQWRAELSATLRASYPAGHPVTLLAGSGDHELIPKTVPVEGLEPALQNADEAVTISC